MANPKAPEGEDANPPSRPPSQGLWKAGGTLWWTGGHELTRIFNHGWTQRGLRRNRRWRSAVSTSFEEFEGSQSVVGSPSPYPSPRGEGSAFVRWFWLGTSWSGRQRWVGASPNGRNL